MATVTAMETRQQQASGAAAAMYAPVGYPQTYAPLKERAAPMFNLEKTLNLKVAVCMFLHPGVALTAGG